MKYLLTIPIVVVIIAAITIYASFCYGLVLSNFYEWFMLPIFPNLVKISVTQFIGISFFANILIRHHSQNIKQEYLEDISTRVIGFLLSPWLVLLIGYLFKAFFL